MIRSRLLREGSVGLFLLIGFILFGGIIFFIKGINWQDKDYLLKLQFANAGGLRGGARVYYRGVPVGRIIDINPSSNGVEVSTEIDGRLRIPSDVKISTLRSGLLGEVSVNIIPKSDLDESSKQISPFNQDCPEQQLILCNNQKIPAQSTPDLVESLAALADRFNDDELFNKFNNTLSRSNRTLEKLSSLSDEVTIIVKQLSKDLNTVVKTTEKIGNTAESLSKTADTATEQIENLGETFSNSAAEISLLATNLNQLIDDNQSNISNAIANLSESTAEISQLAKNTDQLLSNIAHDDVAKISENLSATSDNLLALSEELSNPTNLATLQQTLDSARVTFSNTAKITSDIDEFTGDPEFRSNLRKLINGLSNLVSYTDLLEKQVELATLLEEVEKVSKKENLTLYLEANSQTNFKEKHFPTAFSSSNGNTNKNIKSAHK